MTLAQVGRITVAEFERLIALPENADRKLEFFNGEIIEEMPDSLHASLGFHIATLLGDYLKVHPGGRGFVEPRIRLPDQSEHDVIPDVAFVRQERLEDIIRRAPLHFVPDLCIEIQSEGQSRKLLRDKAAVYLAHSGQMVWLIYPDKKLVEWLTPDADEILFSDDVIDGGAVLPGFSVTVSALLTLP
ncbi:MAG: Uma2 family endonuclease [Chloroflexota bacterium]|nr:Uma2 family endonuclease [Chloroflexota bacterium]